MYNEMLIYIILADNVELELTGLLLKHYGLTTFKDWQLKAIISVLEGRNCLVVQPTGSGKSICFQIPSLYTRKMTVVLTPTISLMTDQCLKLEQNGIPATFLGSSQSDKNIDVKIKDGCFRVVYVTPETFFNESGVPSVMFSKLLQGGLIGLIAIDEVHLIESWKSFRYIYIYTTYTHIYDFFLDLHSSIHFPFVKIALVQ